MMALERKINESNEKEENEIVTKKYIKSENEK